jgi:hypothetical protein
MRGVTTFAAAGAAGHTDNQVGHVDPQTRYLCVGEGNGKVKAVIVAMRMPLTGGQRRGVFCYTKSLMSLHCISTLHECVRGSNILWLTAKDLDTWDPCGEVGPRKDTMDST